ncbi:hypothetical protein V6C03_02020 [Methyloligella sp. 2.7D]|uniref:hypothetical protein n=1 Tax=unclassified Methyloligella TaxID=2625955 RepID=UPI00157C2707|nr:hypothetical protein [Methyloligella sp. GL2]QKP76585.1 hypothetical protein HT051_03400 [Methyloligella sp. GL2]
MAAAKAGRPGAGFAGAGVLLCATMLLASPASAQIERRSLEPIPVPQQQAPIQQAPNQGYPPPQDQGAYGQPQNPGGPDTVQPQYGDQDVGGGPGYDAYGQAPDGRPDSGAPLSILPGDQNETAGPAFNGQGSGQGAPAYQQPSFGRDQYGGQDGYGVAPPPDFGYGQQGVGQQDYGQQQPYDNQQDFGGQNYGGQPPAGAAAGYDPSSNYGAQASYGGASGRTPLPVGVWRGVDEQSLQRLVAGANLPVSSPALGDLIARVLAADPPSGGPEIALRVMALERAGRAEEIASLLGQSAQAGDPGANARYAAALLAVGREEEACRIDPGQVPQTARSDSAAAYAAFLIPAYCAAARGDMGRASQALQMAQSRGVRAPVPAAIIGQLSGSGAARPPMPQTLDVIDYMFLRLGKVAVPAKLAETASPSLLYLLATDREASADLRIAAAERAAKLNIITGEELRAAYTEAVPSLPQGAKAPWALRARLFATLASAPSAEYRAESIDALLASGKDAGIEVALAEALAPESAKLAEDPQAARFAETGVRVAVLAGDDNAAWEWIGRGGQAARGWPLLVAANNPFGQRSGEALQQGAAIASQAQLPPALIHRLITVLDALDYDVPIPLWDMASQSEQPSEGYLPETGVLTELKRASDAGQVGPTVMLVAAALGPDGPKGANLIALGDSVRALKKVGLDAEARRIGFEAIYGHWPFHGKA